MPTIAAEALEFDEIAVKAGLQGNEAEREDALKDLYDHYDEYMMGVLGGKFPGLPADLIANALGDTFNALNDAVIAGTFDYGRSLVNWLLGVARNKAIDELRKISCRTLGNSEFFDTVEECLEDTEVGRLMRRYEERRRADELAQEFRDFLLTLPPVQRQLAQVMADSFPEALLEEEICEQILHRTGKRPNVAQVKSAKREIRRKFKAILSK